MPARRTICAGKRFIAVMHRDIGWLTAEAERWETRGYDASNERSLIASAETVIEAVHQSLRAIVREERRLAALELALFDPDQPRVPAGNPDGGQWTSGEWEGGTPRAVPVGDGRGLPINLLEEDAEGGHTFERHIGKPESYLKARITGGRTNIPYIGGKGERRAGSFTSLEAANKLVNATIAANQDKIDAWLGGSWFMPSGPIYVSTPNGYFGRPTGYEAYSPDDETQPIIQDTYSVEVWIMKDPNSPRGYRVISAWPTTHERY